MIKKFIKPIEIVFLRYFFQELKFQNIVEKYVLEITWKSLKDIQPHFH